MRWDSIGGCPLNSGTFGQVAEGMHAALLSPMVLHATILPPPTGLRLRLQQHGHQRRAVHARPSANPSAPAIVQASHTSYASLPSVQQLRGRAGCRLGGGMLSRQAMVKRALQHVGHGCEPTGSHAGATATPLRST